MRKLYLVERTREKARHGMKLVGAPMKEHPTGTALVCFLSGMVLGGLASQILNRETSQPAEGVDPELNQRVSAIMTWNPMVCTPKMSVKEAARRMVDADCGAIPVVDEEPARRLLGMITDRDMVVRGLALGKDLDMLTVNDCMSHTAVAVSEDNTVEEACRLMQHHQVRRLPVVNLAGRCIGIISQADIAIEADPTAASTVVREVSKPRLLRWASA